MQVESETQFIDQWCCAELDAALAHPHSSLVLVSSCMTVRILYFTIFQSGLVSGHMCGGDMKYEVKHLTCLNLPWSGIMSPFWCKFT